MVDEDRSAQCPASQTAYEHGVIEPSRPARQSLTSGSLRVTRPAEPPPLIDGVGACAHPLRQETCHSVRRCFGR